MEKVTIGTGASAGYIYSPASAAGETAEVSGVSAPVSTETKSTGVNFSAVLAETLQQQMTEAVLSEPGSQSAGSYGSYQGFSGGGIESMVLASAATGQISDAQIAIMMLCMMMETSDSPELSQLMGVMSSMLQNLQDEEVSSLRDNVMSSDYSAYTLDTIDRNIFSSRLGGINSLELPLESWKPAGIRVTSEEGQRSAERLREVIDQFDVENAARYEPFRGGSTYCNIFLWDVTRALGCEIPHYVNPKTGEPMQYPNTKGARELGAIATEEWLLQHGERYGWRQVDAETAQRYANEGKAAVTTAGSIGHVQVVCPSRDGEYDTVRGVTVAQAGRVVTNYTYLSGIYSASGQKNVKYFVHE